MFVLLRDHYFKVQVLLFCSGVNVSEFYVVRLKLFERFPVHFMIPDDHLYTFRR